MRTGFSAAALSIALTTGGSASPQEPSPQSLIQEIDVEQRLGETIPGDLVFRDDRGRNVRFRELVSDRPLLLVPVYYGCPMLCGEVLRGLAGALKALTLDPGVNFDVIVASFDPEDTEADAARKREELVASYGARGRASGVRFLVGDEEATRALTDVLGLRYARDPRTRQFAHASVVVVLTPGGTISRYFFGIDYPPRDLRLSLVEASSGNVGSLVDRVLLYCYHYDPMTGRYGVAIMNLLRLAGGLTVLLVAGLVLRSLRRERRLPTAAPSPHHSDGGTV